MKVVSLDEVKYIKLLIYGDSGSGKTTVVGSFQKEPKTSPLLVLDAGGQPISLRFLDPPPLVLGVEDVSDINYPYDWLSRGQPWELVEKYREKYPFFQAVYDYFDGTEGKFKAVTLDSITQLQRIALDKISSATGNPGDVPRAVQIQEWGQLRAITTNIADKFFKLSDIHVVMTALCMHLHIDAFGISEYGPMLNTKSGLEVPSHAEIVGRLMNLESLGIKKLRAIQDDIPTNAYNVLLIRGSRDSTGKWQGVQDPPEFMFNPTARAFLDVLNN
jgi:hypothetical protein